MLATSTTKEPASEREPVDSGLDEGLGVRHPRVAVGGEVGVVTEDVVGRDVGRKLDQQAPRADAHVQGVEDLAAVELVGGQVALAGRRHAEVDEGVGQLCRAESAVRCAIRSSPRTSADIMNRLPVIAIRSMRPRKRTSASLETTVGPYEHRSMRFRTTRIPGLIEFTPTPHGDGRGFFSRTFDADVAREAGIDPDSFVQDSMSRSRLGVLRGLHLRIGARREQARAVLVRRRFRRRRRLSPGITDLRRVAVLRPRWRRTELDLRPRRLRTWVPGADRAGRHVVPDRPTSRPERGPHDRSR